MFILVSIFLAYLHVFSKIKSFKDIKSYDLSQNYENVIAEIV